MPTKLSSNSIGNIIWVCSNISYHFVFSFGFYLQICDEYARITGHSLEEGIKREFSGDILDGLTAIIQCTSNKAEFFASRLHKSMAGLGTNDTQLIRIIVTRCEIDLHDIKVAFENMYGKSLRSWIKVILIINNCNLYNCNL